MIDSDLNHSDKEYIYLTRNILDMIYCVVQAFYKWKEKKTFYSQKGRQFLMSLFSSSCFSFQTRTDLVLVKFYYNAEVRRFLKAFRIFSRKRLWLKSFFGKFKLFKMDSGKGVFLSVFRTPFYGCFQTFNRNAFLWMITLFGANTPEPSKICQKVKAFSY